MTDVKELLKMLKREYPDARYYLEFSNPLELLVAAILSAQCRDETVNATTKGLFAKYKNPAAYAQAPLHELESHIKSITFYKNKAANIKGACEVVVRDYKSHVPDKMDELIKLPGVGRKTANAIMINAFNKVEGIPVDTHVIRLAYRIGLTKHKAPDKIEQDLMRLIPRSEWKTLKNHGRAVCTSVPKCRSCPISYLCAKQGLRKI
jgi:endonuclease-3